MKTAKTIPITEVLDEMGIEYRKGTREEVEQTLKRLDEAFAEWGILRDDKEDNEI